MNDVLSSWFGLSAEVSIRWGLTLLHFLWQGAVIGLLAIVVASLLRHRAATVRYWSHALALLACPVTVAVTFAVVQIPPGLEESSALEWSAFPEPAIPVAGATLVMHPEIHGEIQGPVNELKTDIHGLLTVEHLADTLYE